MRCKYKKGEKGAQRRTDGKHKSVRQGNAYRAYALAEHYGPEAPSEARQDGDPNALSGRVGDHEPTLWGDDGDECCRKEQAGNQNEETPHILPLPTAEKAHWQGEASVHESG